MRLTHNLAALNVYKEYKKDLVKQSTAMNRISSGYKVNSAKDDPNAIAQSERMRLQMRGLQMAQKNVQDGVSMLQTAEGGLDNITQMIQRVRELTVQAGNDTNNPQDKQTIQNEISQMLQGIDQMASNTEFNGVKPLGNAAVNDNSNPINLDMTVGANTDEKVKIPTYNITSGNLKVSLSGGGSKALNQIDITAPGGVDDALEVIDGAIQTVVSIRSKYGALENRFEDNYDSLGEINDHIQGSESGIRDADIAKEMMEYTRTNVLSEAGNAMMVQANKFPQDVLRILDNVRSR